MTFVCSLARRGWATASAGSVVLYIPDEAIDCHDCHHTISETLVQEGRVLREANEAHIFERNGVCRCGCENPCKHENTVINATGTDGKYVLQASLQVDA